MYIKWNYFIHASFVHQILKRSSERFNLRDWNLNTVCNFDQFGQRFIIFTYMINRKYAA